MRVLLITAFLLVTCPLAVFSQSTECKGVCISQAAANRAAELARENPALQEKIAILEAALLEKDKSIEELRSVAKTNESALQTALHKTEVELALKTGQIIQLEADRVRWTAVIDVLIKNSRKKNIGLINLF